MLNRCERAGDGKANVKWPTLDQWLLGDINLNYSIYKWVTLPKTNIAGWKIHHFDGIYKETWGFSWAMLVSGRVSSRYYI